MPGSSAPIATHPDWNVESLIRDRRLGFAARFIVDGYFAGIHRSRFAEPSAEVNDYRPYAAGDDVRRIDWRAAARADREYIKLAPKDTEMTCTIALDTSASMGVNGGLSYSKFDYARLLTAALCLIAVRQHDRIAFMHYDDQMNRYLPPIRPGAGYSRINELISGLEMVRPGSRSDSAHALRQLFSAKPPRGVLVVVSDLLDDPDPLFDSLALFTYHHYTALLIQILSPAELRLPELPAARFVDPETGSILTSTIPDQRERYEAEMQRFFDAMEQRCRALKIAYCRLATDTPFAVGLRPFLDRHSHAGTYR